MRYLILILALSSTGIVKAETDWLGINTKSDIAAWSAAALIIADYSTTLQMVNSGADNGVHEENGRIADANGHIQSRSDVNKYFLFKLGLHYFINTNKYTRKYKNIWNIYQIGITYDAVSGNVEAGFSIGF